jgi:hypothetical protein
MYASLTSDPCPEAAHSSPGPGHSHGAAQPGPAGPARSRRRPAPGRRRPPRPSGRCAPGRRGRTGLRSRIRVCTRINPLLQLGFRRRAVEVIAIQICAASQRGSRYWRKTSARYGEAGPKRALCVEVGTKGQVISRTDSYLSSSRTKETFTLTRKFLTWLFSTVA